MNETPTEHPAPFAQAAGSPPERLLNQTELADLLNVKLRTVEGWRRRRVGPVYIRIEGQVRYRPEDIETYKAVREGRNSRPVRATKHP